VVSLQLISHVLPPQSAVQTVEPWQSNRQSQALLLQSKLQLV